MWAMTGRWVVGVVGVLMLTGSDAPTSTVGTNGLESKPAAEVRQAAAMALRSAPGVHLISRSEQEGNPARFDLRINGRSASGAMTLGGATSDIVSVDDTVYVKGSAAALQTLGMPADPAVLAADRWLWLESTQVTWLAVTTDDLADQLLDLDSPLEPAVEQTALDGHKVVVITQLNGARVYVANTGTPYPLRVVVEGENAGQADFTEYGADFGIVAPSGAIDAAELAPAGAGPASPAELRWRDSIGALRRRIDEAFGRAGPHHDQAEVAALGAAVRDCTTELVAPGPPSPRLQLVYDLVSRACQQYDAAAECFATAVRFWDVTRGQLVNKALECGLAVRAPASALLADAETQGRRIISGG